MAKLISIIETQINRGKGTESNPSRIVTQYWSIEGELLAEYDMHTDLSERGENERKKYASINNLLK